MTNTRPDYLPLNYLRSPCPALPAPSGCYHPYTVIVTGGAPNNGNLAGLITFSLQNTTAYKGYATNACFGDADGGPGDCSTPDDLGPDYIFECQHQPLDFQSHIVGGQPFNCVDGSAISTPASAKLSTATAVVSSKDTGGSTQVLATVNFDGIIVPVMVTGTDETFARLPIDICGAAHGCRPQGDANPWDFYGNHIADAWEARRYLDANEDNEAGKGDGVADSRGDGYTAFEEYRGFVVYDTSLIDQVHVRTNPYTVKDVFLYDYQAFVQGGGDDLWAISADLLQPAANAPPSVVAGGSFAFHELTKARVPIVDPAGPGGTPVVFPAFNRGSAGIAFIPAAHATSPGAGGTAPSPIVFYRDDAGANLGLRNPDTLAIATGAFAVDPSPIVIDFARVHAAAMPTIVTPAGNYNILIRQTVAHEVGHKLSLRHSHRQVDYTPFPGFIAGDPPIDFPPPMWFSVYTGFPAIPGISPDTLYSFGQLQVGFAPGFVYSKEGELISSESFPEIGVVHACSGKTLDTSVYRTAGPPPADWKDLGGLRYLMLAEEQNPDLCDTARPLGIKNQESLGPDLWNIMNWTLHLPTDIPANYGFNTGPGGVAVPFRIPNGVRQMCAKLTCP